MCCHIIRVITCCVGHGEISPFLVCKPLYIRNRPETFRSNLIQEFKSSYPKIAEDFNQNFSISLHSVLHSWFDNPTCWLLVPVRRTERKKIKFPKLHLYLNTQISLRDSLYQLRLATQKDDELALLKHTIIQGWPSTIKEVPSVIQPYWTFHDELTVEDGLV